MKNKYSEETDDSRNSIGPNFKKKIAHEDDELYNHKEREEK